MTDEKDNLIVIHPNGEYEKWTLKKPLTLEHAQQLVGGYVERVPMFDKFCDEQGNKRSCAVLCDEEGKMKNKPINTRATIEWSKCISLGGDMLVGPVVVVMGIAAKGWR
jgi:hypothetical protein